MQNLKHFAPLTKDHHLEREMCQKYTYCFNLFEGTGCLLMLLLFGSILFPHISKLLLYIFLMTLTKLMVSNAGRIVRYVDFAKITPFVTLANPILQGEKKNISVKQEIQERDQFICNS